MIVTLAVSEKWSENAWALFAVQVCLIRIQRESTVVKSTVASPSGLEIAVFRT